MCQAEHRHLCAYNYSIIVHIHKKLPGSRQQVSALFFLHIYIIVYYNILHSLRHITYYRMTLFN